MQRLRKLKCKPQLSIKTTRVGALIYLITVDSFLIFRPYIDPISVKPYKPADKGYYFKNYNNVAVKLICYTLEDNGFREVNER